MEEGAAAPTALATSSAGAAAASPTPPSLGRPFLSPEFYWTARWRVETECKRRQPAQSQAPSVATTATASAAAVAASPPPSGRPPALSPDATAELPPAEAALPAPASLLTARDHARYLHLATHDPVVLHRCQTPESAADRDDRRQAEIRALVALIERERAAFAAHHRSQALANPGSFGLLLPDARARLATAFREANAAILRAHPRYYTYRGIGLQPDRSFRSGDESWPPPPTVLPPTADAAPRVAPPAPPEIRGALLTALRNPPSKHHPKHVVAVLDPVVDGVPQPLGEAIQARRDRLGKGARKSLPVDVDHVGRQANLEASHPDWLQTAATAAAASARARAKGAGGAGDDGAAAAVVVCSAGTLIALFAAIATGGGLGARELRVPLTIETVETVEAAGEGGGGLPTRRVTLSAPMHPQRNLREWNQTFLSDLEHAVFAAPPLISPHDQAPEIAPVSPSAAVDVEAMEEARSAEAVADGVVADTATAAVAVDSTDAVMVEATTDVAAAEEPSADPSRPTPTPTTVSTSDNETAPADAPTQDASPPIRLWQSGADGPNVVFVDTTGAMSLEGTRVIPWLKVQHHQAGPEDWLLHEVATLWARGYFGGGVTEVAMARVDVTALSVVRVERHSLRTLGGLFDPLRTLALLRELLGTLASARDPGRYLLLQRAREATFKLSLWREAAEEGRSKSVHDLQSGGDPGTPLVEPPSTMCVPVTAHWGHKPSRIPGTFPAMGGKVPSDRRGLTGVCFAFHNTRKCDNPECPYAHHTPSEAAALEPGFKVPPLAAAQMSRPPPKQKQKQKQPKRRATEGNPAAGGQGKKRRKRGKKGKGGVGEGAGASVADDGGGPPIAAAAAADAPAAMDVTLPLQ